MEIKRRLNALAKTMTPEIEAMNVGREMKQLCKRLERLVAYAEEKIARSAQRKAAKEKTLGQQAKDRHEAETKVIFDHQTAESDANLADQKEAFDERNERLRDKGQPEMESSVNVDAKLTPDPVEVISAVGPVKKKLAKKKAKKK